MMESKLAGPCARMERHKWGKEINFKKFAMRSTVERHCEKCLRVQVIEYTQRGNHVRGYFNREGTA